MTLDYSLKTTDERIQCVNQVISETPPEKLTRQYLSYMADYILFVNDKNQTKKERKSDDGGILTKNRKITINKREISFEGLVASLENGEDGIHTMIINDKNQIMDRREPITQEDIENIPYLQEYMETINKLNDQLKTAVGKSRYIIKSQIIETWQAMYMIKASAQGIPMKRYPTNYIKTMAHLNLDENITIDEEGMPHSDGNVSLFNPHHVSFLLRYYPILKEESYDDFQNDMRFMLMDLENLAEKTLRDNHPLLWDLLIFKIDGVPNEEIKHKLESMYNVSHSEQYYSTLWCKRIPRLIAEQAQKDWLIWYYTNEEYGHWKKCGRCGEIKLAHPMFFSRNTSADGWYSICKECRSKK